MIIGGHFTEKGVTCDKQKVTAITGALNQKKVIATYRILGGIESMAILEWVTESPPPTVENGLP